MKFIFIHIHRTGGTSIARFFNHPRKHRTIHFYAKEPYFEDAFKFAFVRNPWDKMVNYYCWRQQKSNNRWKKDGPRGVDFSTWLKALYGVYKANEGKVDIYPVVERRDVKHLLPFGMNLIPQLNWISQDDGELLVDFVGRFEKLRKDFKFVCKQIGVEPRKLPWVNRTKHKHYSTYYNGEDVEIVGEIFKKDIQYFGFKFERELKLL